MEVPPTEPMQSEPSKNEQRIVTPRGSSTKPVDFLLLSARLRQARRTEAQQLSSAEVIQGLSEYLITLETADLAPADVVLDLQYRLQKLRVQAERAEERQAAESVGLLAVQAGLQHLASQLQEYDDFAQPSVTEAVTILQHEISLAR